MVSIDPQTQLGVDRVASVDDGVSVSTVLRLVEYRQRKKAVGIVGRGLRSEVPKQLCAVVDFAIAVPVQDKEGVGGARSSPAYLGGLTRVKQIEFHAACVVCKVKPRTVHVDNDRATGVDASVRIPYIADQGGAAIIGARTIRTGCQATPATRTSALAAVVGTGARATEPGLATETVASTETGAAVDGIPTAGVADWNANSFRYCYCCTSRGRSKGPRRHTR